MCRFDCIYYKLFTFLSVDMEILTHPEVAKCILRCSRRMHRQLKGAKISIFTDRNVNNEFILGYSKK